MVNRACIRFLLFGIASTLAASVHGGDKNLSFAQKLSDAYRKNDPVAVKAAIKEWRDLSGSALKSRPKPTLDLEAEVDSLYLLIVGNTIMDESRKTVFVIQPTIDVFVSEQPEGILQEVVGKGQSFKDWPRFTTNITLNNFGPKPLATIPHVVLLDKDHEEGLLQFLSGKDNVFSEHRWTIHSDSEESKKRKEFIKNEIVVTEGHWGTGWFFESFPVLEGIVFNPTRTKAFVRVRLHHGGEFVSFEKRDNKWVKYKTDTIRGVVE